MSDTPSKRGKVNPRRSKAVALENERRVLNLRLAGMDFDSIAREVGYADGSGAYRAYQRAMARTVQPVADEVRAEEVARLDRLALAYWPRALGAGGQDPSPKAAEVVFRAMDRRARLLGLEAPVRQEIDLTTYDDSDEVRKRVAELAALLGGTPRQRPVHMGDGTGEDGAT